MHTRVFGVREWAGRGGGGPKPDWQIALHSLQASAQRQVFAQTALSRLAATGGQG